MRPPAAPRPQAHWGVDLSAPLLERARELTAAEAIDNVTYEHGDAQKHAVLGGTPAAATDDPFSLGEPAATTRMLERAGFCGVSFDDVHAPVFYGHDIETALAFVRSFRSTSAALARLDPAAADRALDRLRDTLAAHRNGPDGVAFDSRAWIITARRR